MVGRRGLLVGILASFGALAWWRRSPARSPARPVVLEPAVAPALASTGPWTALEFDARGHVAAVWRYRKSGLLVRTERREHDGYGAGGDRLGWAGDATDALEVTDSPARMSRFVTPAEAAAERARLDAADVTLRAARVMPVVDPGNIADWRNGGE